MKEVSICKEHLVPIDEYKAATLGDYTFLHIENPGKIIAKKLE